jgi:hypothetical protein
MRYKRCQLPFECEMMRLPWVEAIVLTASSSSSSSVCWHHTTRLLLSIVFVVLHVFTRLVLISILVLSAAVASRAMCLPVYMYALALVSFFSLILFCLTAIEWWRVVVHAHVVIIVVFFSLLSPYMMCSISKNPRSASCPSFAYVSYWA